MEALALAVATAVLQYLLDKADLIENVRGWLKRDPASLAYQRALLRAYAAFARSDPVLAKSFFDETFLARAAVPELAKQLTRDQQANATELARLWAYALYGETNPDARDKLARDDAHVRACGGFLHVLEAELKQEPEFRDMFDSRALDTLERNVVELTRVLTEQRDAELKRAEKYQSIIQNIAYEHGVRISDNASVHVDGDFVAGDKRVKIQHAYFSGDFAALDDLYVEPLQVFKRVRVHEFIGREWLTARVESFINDPAHTSGYLRIEGEAGVGKTSFLAHLVHERGYPHILSDELRGDDNVQRALLSLGAQLVARYHLEPYADRNTLPAIAGDAMYLYKLLDKAREQLSAGEKIVVVVDALDEAGIGVNGNVFGLPSSLPERVYFILTQRPVHLRLELKTPAARERVHPNDERNLDDMQTYVRGVAHHHNIASQLAAQHYTHEDFVRVLTEKSNGVWIYLQYVMDEIRDGTRHPLNLDNLPSGLIGYYLAYWGDWRAGQNGRGKGEEAWYALYLPLLTTLAAAQEPITLDTLNAWAGVNANPYSVSRLLNESWRAFITEWNEGGAPRYALYHASMRDFLTGDRERNDLSKLSDAERSFIDELRDGTRTAHQRIVASFRARCGGEWTKLIPDDYSLRYLPIHLIQAGAIDELYSLINADFMWAKRSKFGSHRSFGLDLEQTIQTLQISQLEDIPRRIGYSLLYASLGSLTENITPNVIWILTQLGQVERAASYAEMMVDPKQRAEAFRTIGGGGVALWGRWWEPQVKLDGAFLKRAVEEASKISDDEDRFKFVRQLAPELARAGETEGVLRIVESMETEEPETFRNASSLDFMKKIPAELARTGKSEEAIRVAEFINEKYRQGYDLGREEDVLRRTEIFGKVAVNLAIAGKVLEAIELAVSVDAEKDNLWKELGREDRFGEGKNRVLRHVAHDIKINDEWLVARVKKASGIEDQEARAIEYKFIAQQIEETNAWQLEDYKRLFGHDYSIERIRTFESKVSQLVWLGKVDEAIGLLNQDKYLHLDDRVKEQLVDDLLSTGRVTEAKDLTEGFGFSSQRDRVKRWEERASPLLEQIREGYAEEVLETIRDAIFHTHDWRMREVLEMIAPDLIARGYIEQTISILRDDRYEHLIPATRLAGRLARIGRLLEAEAVFDRLVGSEDFAIPLVFYPATGPMAREGNFNEIIEFARRFVRKLSLRCELLTEVAFRLVNVNREAALKILEEALSDSESLDRALYDLVDTFAAMSAGLLDAGQAERAFSIADKLANRVPGIWAETVAAYLADLERHDKQKAESAFKDVLTHLMKNQDPREDRYERRNKNVELIRALCKRERFELAIEVQNLIKDDSNAKSQALAVIAGALATSDPDRAKAFLQNAWSLAQKDSEAIKEELVITLVSSDWLEGAMDIAQWSQDNSLVQFVRFFAILNSSDLGQQSEAEVLLAEIENPDTKAQFARGFISKFLDAGKPDLAMALLSKADNIPLDEKVSIWTDIAFKFAESAQSSKAEQALENIEEKSERLEAQVTLITQLVESGAFAEAKAIINGVEDHEWGSYLENFLEMSTQNKLLLDTSSRHTFHVKRTFEMLNKVEEMGARCWLLIHSAPDFASIGQVSELLNLAKGIRGFDLRQRTLAEIALQLAEKGFIEDAFSAADGMNDHQVRFRTLCRIASELKYLKLNEATKGTSMLLDKVRTAGRDETCRLLSYIVPTIFDFAGPVTGAEIVWKTYEEIQKTEQMLQRN